jgi:hypothetical protein
MRGEVEPPLLAPVYLGGTTMKKTVKKATKKVAATAAKKTAKKTVTKATTKTAKKTVTKATKKTAKPTMKKVFTAKPKKAISAKHVCNCQCSCACALGYGEANMFDTGWATQSGTTHAAEK